MKTKIGLEISEKSSTAMAHFPDNQIVYKEIIVEVTVSEEKSDI